MPGITWAWDERHYEAAVQAVQRIIDADPYRSPRVATKQTNVARRLMERLKSSKGGAARYTLAQVKLLHEALDETVPAENELQDLLDAAWVDSDRGLSRKERLRLAEERLEALRHGLKAA